MKEAYVWSSDTLIGRFWEYEDSSIDFEYKEGATAPLSLSLPLNGSWDDNAPGLYLDGLLPDSEAEREAMKRVLHAETNSPLDLLIAVDSTGGLVFTKEPVLDSVDHLQRQVAREEEIGNQVNLLANNRGSWQAKDGRSQFSLAGTQCKFSLAKYGDKWLWPSAKYPSTHIVKPASKAFPEVDQIEHAMMNLAAACGVNAAKSKLMTFAGNTAYAVERFDRKVLSDGTVQRLHIEDLTQSLGISRSEKYSVNAKDAFTLLKDLPNGYDLCKEWVHQLAFNTIIGNCDAHGKNYSLFLPANGPVSLCPLYDCICTKFWTDVSDTLAMPINGKQHAEDISLDDWAAEAALDGVSQADVVEIVANVALDVARKLDSSISALGETTGMRLRQAIAENNTTLFSELGLLAADRSLSQKPSRDVIEHLVFPKGLHPGTLSKTLFEAIPEDGPRLRLEFHPGIKIKYDQDIDNMYVLVKRDRIDKEGNVTLGTNEEVTLYDARYDMPVDTIWWEHLCEPNRHALGTTGYLFIDGNEETGFSTRASIHDRELEGETRKITNSAITNSVEPVANATQNGFAPIRPDFQKNAIRGNWNRRGR